MYILSDALLIQSKMIKNKHSEILCESLFLSDCSVKLLPLIRIKAQMCQN